MKYLFRSKDGFQFFREKRAAITEEIDTLSKVELESSDDSLKIILKAKHTLASIEFAEPYRVDKGEVQIDISNDRRFAAHLFRDARTRKRVYKKGRRIEVHLPFLCDEELFETRPSTYTTVLPKAEIRNNELVFTVDFFSDVDTLDQIEKKINRETKLIKTWAGFLNKDIESFNGSIDSIIDSGLSARRKKLSLDDKILGQLGVQKETVLLRGFVKPEKKLDLKILKEDKEKEIEPSLEMETYNEIIQLVNSLGINLERSSERLRELDEESLRDTILVALNSVYRGMASAEAFNREGKTDILIKYQDKNVFIAECKIWKGNAYFTEGIAQLLSYLTWRDSKTSYVIFSKNQDVKNVIQKSKALLEAHANYVAKGKEISDSCVTYRFRQSVETTSQCLITLHVFDLGSR